MIELGKVQELVIIRTKEFGVYLAEKEGDEAAVLLPKKQVPEGAGIGDKVEVFRWARQRSWRSRMWLKSELFWIWDWRRICFFRLRSRPTR